MPGPLGDVVLGKHDAKVTIYRIRLADLLATAPPSTTKTWPALKSKYIDTGKVRFILREFPLDPLATAGFMLARCAGDDKYYADHRPALRAAEELGLHRQAGRRRCSALMKQAGFTQESFEACLKNQQIYDARELPCGSAARKTFDVNSTPTFFINGQMQRGALSIEELDKILAPLVGS